MFARFSYDQAQSYVPGGAPGFAEQGAFASNQSIANHARNAAISETHIFSPNTINQVSFGFNRIFDYITSQGNASCYANAIGIPNANLGGNSCGLTSVELSGPYWSLGDRGYTPFIGGTNVWTFSDSLRHGARQARSPRRRLHPREPVEHRGRWFPQRFLGGHGAVGPAMPRRTF